MDAIVGLLDGPRARGAFLLRALMDPPWSVPVQDEAPLSLLAMVRGDAWVVPDRRGKTTHLGPGDVGSRGVRIRTPSPTTRRHRESDATGGAVARQVGYASPFALSTAFKRVRGVSPRQHRVAALAK
jgi:Cupin/Bacterial regulatory helix-turn-helix proteins, AraC family